MSNLPSPFSALAPFIDTWAGAGLVSRAAARSQATAQERQAFYDVAQPLLHPALDYLDTRPLASLDDGDRILMRMMLSLAGVGLAVETHKSAEEAHALSRRRLQLVDCQAL